MDSSDTKKCSLDVNSSGKKIVFAGGKNVGYGILKYLLKTESILMIFTNPSDENEQSWYKTVKPIALQNSIPYTTRHIKEFEEWFREHDVDYIVCAYYDMIIPAFITKYAQRGGINVHMGLAEEYRGCYPTTFPIIDSKNVAGVTIHQITPDIDAGAIYGQAKVPIENDETGKSLYYKCTDAAIGLFIEKWAGISSGECVPRNQSTSNNTRYHSRNDFPFLEIDLNWEIDKIDRYVRALTFPPFPRPFFKINENVYEIIHVPKKNK